MKKTILTMCVVLTFVFGTSVVFTGCRNKSSDNNTTTEDTSENASTGTDGTSAADDAANAVDDVADGAADAVDDVTDGAANAVDDIANGFDDYGDAHDYLLSRLGKENKNAQYEVRNETKDVTEYRNGAKGYHFEIYDTSDESGKKYGDFYVDKDTGKIYKKDTKTKKIKEYNSNAQ